MDPSKGLSFQTGVDWHPSANRVIMIFCMFEKEKMTIDGQDGRTSVKTPGTGTEKRDYENPMGGFLGRYGWIYLPGIAFLALSSYLQVLVPRQLGLVIDLLDRAGGMIDEVAVRQALVGLLLIALAVFGARFAWRSLIMGNSRNLEKYLRERLFSHFLSLPTTFFQQRKTGDLMAYAINDIGAIRMTFGPGLALAANAIVLGFLSISRMTGTVDPRLTLFALLPVPVILILAFRLGTAVQRRFRRVQETFAAVSDRVSESISGIQVIKAYSQEEEEASRFETLNRQSFDNQMRMTAVSAAMSPTVSLFFGISFSVSLIYGSQLVLNQSISLGDFVAFNGYLTLIVNPVQSVARIINMVQKGLASWKRYQDIVTIVPDIKDGPQTIPDDQLPTKSDGRLTAEHLTFRYQGQGEDALSDITLQLSPGRRVGILGRTGSGKTTLANLLVRLHEAPAGCIRLDGRELTDYPLVWLRRQVATVPQDNFLFSASILDNIRFFDDDISIEQVQKAAIMADLHETVLDFPDGYETILGERGVTLSGGQKQRVSLARALVRQAPILILDDALSAVDTETERRILTALKGRHSDQAVLIIANRVSALQDCDEILVLEGGRVTGRGTHRTLLDQSGLYAEIAALQRESTTGGEG